MPRVAALFIVAPLVIGQISCPTRTFADSLLQLAPLEQERVHPSLDVEIPPFLARPGTRRFVIFNNIIGLKPPLLLYLRVPDEFAGPDTVESTRTWGLNLLVHYPDMTGPGNPENTGKHWDCAGGCPGDMLISIYNDTGLPRFGSEMRLEVLEKQIHDAIPGLVKYSEMERSGFSRILKEEHGQNPANSSNRIYFIKSTDDNSVSFFAECSYNSEVHLCQVVADLPTFRGVEVDYGIHLEEIDNWERIQNDVFAFVSKLTYGLFDQKAGAR